jgi:hypothetical protein
MRLHRPDSVALAPESEPRKINTLGETGRLIRLYFLLMLARTCEGQDKSVRFLRHGGAGRRRRCREFAPVASRVCDVCGFAGERSSVTKKGFDGGGRRMTCGRGRGEERIWPLVFAHRTAWKLPQVEANHGQGERGAGRGCKRRARPTPTAPVRRRDKPAPLLIRGLGSHRSASPPRAAPGGPPVALPVVPGPPPCASRPPSCLSRAAFSAGCVEPGQRSAVAAGHGQRRHWARAAGG